MFFWVYCKSPPKEISLSRLPFSNVCILQAACKYQTVTERIQFKKGTIFWSVVTSPEFIHKLSCLPAVMPRNMVFIVLKYKAKFHLSNAHKTGQVPNDQIFQITIWYLHQPKFFKLGFLLLLLYLGCTTNQRGIPFG